MKEIYVKYHIGENSFTKEYPVTNPIPINKQLNLSLPLITGATIHLPIDKDIKVLVGKEIDLNQIALDKPKLEEYDLNLDELADLSLKGYSKACLLNFKKYNQIVIGINKDDMIVSDYFSLKKIIDSLAIPYKSV